MKLLKKKDGKTSLTNTINKYRSVFKLSNTFGMAIILQLQYIAKSQYIELKTLYSPYVTTTF